jgi:hypothetical protein
MKIKKIELQKNKKPENNNEEKQERLLNLTLPAPLNQNPGEKLSYGAHNAAHMKNYQEIANVLQRTINNQKLLALSLTNLEKKVEVINKNILKRLNKLIKQGRKK